jgi:hypothetical protein
VGGFRNNPENGGVQTPFSAKKSSLVKTGICRRKMSVFQQTGSRALKPFFSLLGEGRSPGNHYLPGFFGAPENKRNKITTPNMTKEI